MDPGAPRIAVVGAALMDLVSYVPRLPALGETLHGSDFKTGFGGKGANQAVMAARLGARVGIVTRIGRDTFGDGMLQNFRSLGIDTTYTIVDDDAPSGVATIAVDPNGDNSIVIVTGATEGLTPADVESARPALAAADVVVCQLEVPLDVTLAALRVAREEGTPTILNPAPARDGLDDAYGSTDLLCPNEPEAALLLGRPVAPGDELAAAAELRALGPPAVVLTLGERGCAVLDETGGQVLPGVRANTLDTTGAGDAFVGTLAVGLARGEPLAVAAARANRVAAVSVERLGTQTSFPSAGELGGGLFG